MVTMNEVPLSKAYRFIEPGPVVLVTTANEERANIMTMSWHMVMDFTPLIGCIIAHGITASRPCTQLKNA